MSIVKCSTIKDMEPSEGPNGLGGPKMDARCCFFGQWVGISKLENQVSSVQWPSLTKKQRDKKLLNVSFTFFGMRLVG